MKLEVTMKEMQELMNRKGQLEIMGKSYTLNPQDELLIKFMMDFKERHQTDYYDILSNYFNDILMKETMQYNCGIAGGINLVPLSPGFYSPQGGRVEPMPVRPYQQSYGYYPDMSYNQAPQMSYNDMKNMYKNKFAQQLGLDIDGDENHEDPTYDGCDCHVCDGNCEANLPDENKNGIDKDDFKAIKSFLNENGNLKEDRWCNDCVAMGIECDDNCEKHHEDFEKIKSMSYNLGYKDAQEDGKDSKKVKTEENNPFAKAMMGYKVNLNDPDLKKMPKVETYQANVKEMDQPQPNITSDKIQKMLSSKVTKTTDDGKVVSSKVVKTSDVAQKILSSKVKDNEDK